MKKNKKIIINLSKFKTRYIVGALGLIISISIFIKLIVPIIISIVAVLLSLIAMYPLLDTNFKFIAGVCFIVLLWKIYETLFYIFMFITKYSLNRFDENNNK